MIAAGYKCVVFNDVKQYANFTVSFEGLVDTEPINPRLKRVAERK